MLLVDSNVGLDEATVGLVEGLGKSQAGSSKSMKLSLDGVGTDKEKPLTSRILPTPDGVTGTKDLGSVTMKDKKYLEWITAVKNLKIATKPSAAAGGICIDWIEKALEKLRETGVAGTTEVHQAFVDYKTPVYSAVKKKTEGDSLFTGCKESGCIITFSRRTASDIDGESLH